MPLPAGWQDRFPQDVNAPSIGNWRGWAKLLWTRRKRIIGQDRSERLHETVVAQGSEGLPLTHFHDQTSS